MKPSTVRKGAKLFIKQSLGNKNLVAYFVERIPAQCGRKAVNVLRVSDFAGLYGQDDRGITEMSDYDLSRRGEYV